MSVTCVNNYVTVFNLPRCTCAATVGLYLSEYLYPLYNSTLLPHLQLIMHSTTNFLFTVSFCWCVRKRRTCTYGLSTLKHRTQIGLSQTRTRSRRSILTSWEWGSRTLLVDTWGPKNGTPSQTSQTWTQTGSREPATLEPLEKWPSPSVSTLISRHWSHQTEKWHY